MKSLKALLVLLLIVFAAGCAGSAGDRADSVPSPTSDVATTEPVATPTVPVSTATTVPVSTATSVPVSTATSVPVSTATSVPVPSATSVPAPADPIVLVGLVGQSLPVLDGASVVVTAVTEDSRCPEDVVCVWEGELRVSAVWTDSGGNQTPLDLYWAYHKDPTVLPGGTYQIRLDDVVQTDGGSVVFLTVFAV